MLPAGIRRFFRLGRARDVEAEVDAEIAFHFEQKVEALVARGLGRDDARAEANRQFGDVRSARAVMLEADRGDAVQRGRRDWLAEWWMDLRHALRGLARAPGLAVTVVVMLGLGMGGASAMYGLLDRLLFRVGPQIGAPDELRRLYVNEYDAYFTKARTWRSAFSVSHLRLIAQSFPDTTVIVWMARDQDRVGERSGRVIPVALYSGNAFRILKTTSTIGRLLEPSDDLPGAPPAAVISYALWRREFGGDPAVLGRQLELASMSYTIVGVAARGFSGLRHDRVDAWLPVTLAGPSIVGPRYAQQHGVFDAVIRLPAGVDPLLLAASAQRVYRAQPDRDSSALASLESVLPWRRPGAVSDTQRLSLIVAGVAAMLCFIAVANATNLLLLRSVARRRETAVRLALGAGRGRILRGVLIESTMLAVGGAAAAGLVGGWGGELLRKLIIRSDWQQGLLEPRVMLFAGALGLVIGVVTGLVPGVQASGPAAITALKAGARAGFTRSRLRGSLLVLQAALTVVLACGLGLYVRSFLKASGADYVVDARHLLNVSVELPPEDSMTGPGHAAQVTAELAQRIRGVPGVIGVARTSTTPIYGYGGAALRVEVAGGVQPVSMDRRGPFFAEIDSAFLTVTGLPLLRGRAFTGAEVATHAPVALVNDAMAARLWPGQEPMGKCIYVGFASESVAGTCRQIVGIVGSYRNQLDETERMQNYYVPLGYHWNGPGGGHSLVVRSAGSPDRLIPSLLTILRERLPASEPDAVMSIAALVNRDLEPWRAGTKLFALFAGLAVLLAIGGLYSVVAWSVMQRAREFSIRIAIGARAPDLVRLVLATALRPVAVGLLLGLGLALYLVRFLGGLLYETGLRDPVALGGATLLMLAAAGIACIVPARAAARTNPREALQAD